MSKPTHKQKLVIEMLKKQCDYWLTTNDIHSPSHVTDIDSGVAMLELDDEIARFEGERLAEVITNVWVEIAELDPRKNR